MESGNDKSSSTRAVSPPDRRSRPSDRQSASCSANGAAGSSRIFSSMRRASPALSSISRTLWVEVLMACLYGSMPIRRKGHDGQPEHVDRFHHHHELLQVDRLGHVAVGVQVVSAHHVLL